MSIWVILSDARRKAISPGRVSAASSPRWSARFTGTTACTSMRKKTNKEAFYNRKQKKNGFANRADGYRYTTERKLELLVADLAQRLQEVSGKKVYGYLPPRVKRIVDEIVDELAKDERVSSAYALWQDLESSFALTIIRLHRSVYRCRSKRSSRLCATWSSGNATTLGNELHLRG